MTSNVSDLCQHLNLRDHLAKFGIRPRDAALDPKQSRRLQQLSRPLARGNAKKAELVAFYEFIAQPQIAAAVHANKADAIRACGEFAESRLAGTRILDIGCNIGYLATWYALRRPDAIVHGIDLSPSSIGAAQRYAARFGIGNLRFAVADGHRYLPEQPFDTLVDTQGMVDHDSDPATLRRLLSWLKPDGRLICIPALGSFEKFSTFLDKLDWQDASVASLTWLPFANGPQRCAYPALIVTPGQSAQALTRDELNRAYQFGVLDFHRQARVAASGA